MVKSEADIESFEDGLRDEEAEDGWFHASLGVCTFHGASDTEANIIKVSVLVAMIWWCLGLFTVISTRSLAVLASLVDASIDLIAQGVLLGSNRLAKSGSLGKKYLASRLEPVGVVVCAVLTVLASGAVIYYSAFTFVLSLLEGPKMDFSIAASAMLAVVVTVKVVVWRVAKSEYDRSDNISLEALALDNFNDILSNTAALVFASLTHVKQAVWWMDPVGGVLISGYIIHSWCMTASEQVNMLLGKQADPRFIGTVRELAQGHDLEAELVNVRAYHIGPKLIVEIDLIMDKQTPLEVSHDVGTSLQDKVERLEECERCFVHIDYKQRDSELHDSDVPMEARTSTGDVRRRSGTSGLRLRTALVLRKLSRRSLEGYPDLRLLHKTYNSTPEPGLGWSRESLLRRCHSKEHEPFGPVILPPNSVMTFQQEVTPEKQMDIQSQKADVLLDGNVTASSSRILGPDLLEGSEGSAPPSDALLSPL